MIHKKTFCLSGLPFEHCYIFSLTFAFTIHSLTHFIMYIFHMTYSAARRNPTVGRLLIVIVEGNNLTPGEDGRPSMTLL